jgi:hypothetical protein
MIVTTCDRVLAFTGISGIVASLSDPISHNAVGATKLHPP